MATKNSGDGFWSHLLIGGLGAVAMGAVMAENRDRWLRRAQLALRSRDTAILRQRAALHERALEIDATEARLRERAREIGQAIGERDSARARVAELTSALTTLDADARVQTTKLAAELRLAQQAEADTERKLRAREATIFERDTEIAALKKELQDARSGAGKSAPTAPVSGGESTS